MPTVERLKNDRTLRSALRDALNRERFFESIEPLRLDIRVLTGDEEARLRESLLRTHVHGITPEISREEIAGEVRDAIARAHEAPDGGPVFVGHPELEGDAVAVVQGELEQGRLDLCDTFRRGEP